MPATTTREHIVVLLLRLGGCLTGTAFLAMLMPTAWMVSTHAGLGMGEFPTIPITDYLTRSIAGLYGFHGVLLLLISTDVRRYRTLVAYVGAMNLVFGTCLLAIDLHAQMPPFWTWSEGPGLIALGAAILYLRRGIPDARS